MRLFGGLIFGLIFQSLVWGQESPQLYPGPENPLFFDFLLPSQAEQMFSASTTSPAGRLAGSYYEYYIQAFYETLGSAEVRRDFVEATLLSMSDSMQTSFDSGDLAWVENFNQPELLSVEQKTLLASAINLERIESLRLPQTLAEIRLLENFYQDLESDRNRVEEYLQIDALYASEKLDEIEFWLEEHPEDLQRPQFVRGRNIKASDLTYSEMADFIVWIREQEAKTPGSSLNDVQSILAALKARDAWGTLTMEQRERIDFSTQRSLQQRFEDETEADFRRSLLNPVGFDFSTLSFEASATRAPALAATGLALRYMTRWLTVNTGFAQSYELFLRQTSLASGLDRSTLERWIKDPSKGLIPKGLSASEKAQLRELMKRPDFREAYKGARRQFLQEQRVQRMAEKAFGPDARDPSQRHLENEVYAQGVDQRIRMQEACMASLAAVNEGKMKLQAARRMLYRDLKATGSMRSYRTSLRQRARQFIEEEFGVSNRFWNYFPFQLRRSWLPIRRNPVRRLEGNIRAMGDIRDTSIFRFVPNTRIPTGSHFGNAWPLEYSPSMVTSLLARSIGNGTLVTSLGFVIADPLMYAAHEFGATPNADKTDPNENKVLKSLIEELDTKLEMQAVSIQELYVQLESLELQISTERRHKGILPVSVFVDPRSATLPEKETGRVSSVYVIIMPVQSSEHIDWAEIDRSLLVRFDSVWEAPEAESLKEVSRAYWKPALVIDIGQANEEAQLKFREALGIDPNLGLWIDPEKAGGFEFKAPEAVIFRAD